MANSLHAQVACQSIQLVATKKSFCIIFIENILKTAPRFPQEKKTLLGSDRPPQGCISVIERLPPSPLNQGQAHSVIAFSILESTNLEDSKCFLPAAGTSHSVPAYFHAFEFNCLDITRFITTTGT